MAALKPWYMLVTPRQDLLENKSLDQSEFAVHLDQVRDERAPDVYTKPEQFFERTFLTQNLTTLAAEVVRRLSGETVDASPVFNLATQFGGGKTHALTLLYHLAIAGSAADKWIGVSRILERASMPSVPEAACAVFVGTQFDSITGRGGEDGTPARFTPWGDIAYQLGGAEGFALVAEHDRQRTAPGGDVIRQILPADRPALILIDEVMNYVSRYRSATGLGAQFYNFLQNLSEEVRGRNNVVLAVSIPKSEMEMTADDHADYQRFDKMLSRLGKAIVMSAEDETSEIIRRRLFEWDSDALSVSGKVMLEKEATRVCKEYADWVVNNRGKLPDWFPVDHAQEVFQSTYPFHPSVISVFERKWQVLPQFQRTRGVLQMLALWVSRAYSDATSKARKDLLIGLGTAPLEESSFRTTVFGQIGDDHLEPVVTTDICGKIDSHAERRDLESVDAIKKSQMHRKVATTIFFESNGGQQHAEATVPEIRLAVGAPGFDIGNVETILETLTDSCYYLQVVKDKYQFSHRPNLNKLLADRRATIQPATIEEIVRKTIQTIFNRGKTNAPVFFPTDSSDIPNLPALTFVVLPPDQPITDEVTLPMMEKMTREYGSSGRTFKSALLWCVADSGDAIYEEARKFLAWEDIRGEYSQEQLGSDQWRQLSVNVEKAKRALEESIWRAYRYVYLLAKDNSLRQIDLGGGGSSISDTLIGLIVQQLRQSDELLATAPAPSFLVRNWPPALTEWSTRAARDAFFASPIYPRLSNAEVVRTTIVRGVVSGELAYGVAGSPGERLVFRTNTELHEQDIEISDDAFIITRAEYDARAAVVAEPSAGDAGTGYVATKEQSGLVSIDTTEDSTGSVPVKTVAGFSWSGQLTQNDWMSFYTKVLIPAKQNADIILTLTLDASSDHGIPEHVLDAIRSALRELRLPHDLAVKELTE